MQIFKKAKKEEVFVSFFVFLWILFANIAAVALQIQSWPMFFVMVFFVIMKSDVKKIPDIFVGGAVGLLAAVGLKYGLSALTPLIGDFGAFILLISVILGVIIIGNNFCPVAFNNIAFGYLAVATIHLEELTFSSVVNNLLVLFIGGGIVIAGAIFITKMCIRFLVKRSG